MRELFEAIGRLFVGLWEMPLVKLGMLAWIVWMFVASYRGNNRKESKPRRDWRGEVQREQREQKRKEQERKP